MGKRVELKGRRFGKLVVQYQDGRDKHGNAQWFCKCDCGKTKTVLGANLRQRRRTGKYPTTSCSCDQYRLRVKPHKYVMFDYLASAKSKHIPFKLTEDAFAKLVTSPCNYCGRPPERQLSPSRMRKNSIHAAFRWNGIDRIDSDKGYTEDNCVPCCQPCNEMKSDKSRDEFLSQIKTIHEHQVFSQQNLTSAKMRFRATIERRSHGRTTARTGSGSTQIPPTST